MSNVTPGTAKNRRRFFITISFFLIANILAWVAYDRYFGPKVRGTLKIESFEPGESRPIMARETIRWRFNADVIPTAAYGRDPGIVSPAVAGRWIWEDTKTLAFKPDADFPRATKVTFTLADGLLRGLGGAKLTAPATWTVESTPLQVEEIHQAGIETGNRYVIELKFNDKVIPGDVLAHLSARKENGETVHCKLHGQVADRVVRLLTDAIALKPDSDSSITLDISPGLMGMSGPLGMTTKYENSLWLGRALSATSLSAESPARGSAILRLSFNDTVDVNALKQIISIEPAIEVTYQNSNNNQVEILGEFKPSTRYTVKLAKPPAGTDAKKYPLPGQLAAFIPDRSSGFWFDAQQGYLSSAGNRTLMIHAVNLDGVIVHVTRVYDNNLVAWRNAGDRYWAGETESYSKPIAEKKIPLAHEKNVQHDIPISLDDLLPKNEPREGVYRVIAEPDDQSEDEHGYRRYYSGSESSVVTMSDIALTAKQTRLGAVVWATSLHTAAPLAGVRVRLFSSKNQPLGETLTNADGLATFPEVHPAKEEDLAVILADCPIPTDTTMGPPTTQPSDISLPTNLTWLDLRHTGWQLGDSNTSGPEYIRTTHEAFVYSERGVYRPGETVHLRAIVRGEDNTSPATAFPVQWKIFRPDGKDWKSETVLLDADGTAAIDLFLPSDLPTGMWTASIGLPGETEYKSQFGSLSFGIEEFIPNRMKVSLKLDNNAPRYTISDKELTAQIQSDYLFGRPAAGLTAELSAKARPTGFQPDGWKEFEFGDVIRYIMPLTRKKPHVSQRPKPSENSSEKTLDANGHLNWSIDVHEAIGDDESENRYLGPWSLNATAGVHEAGGRTVNANQMIDIDELPYYIGIRRIKSGTLKPGENCEFQARLVRPDGSSTDSAELEATLSRCNWNTTYTYTNGEYRYESTRTLETIQTGKVNAVDGKVSWSTKIPHSGSFIISFRDTKTGARSSCEVYATDGSAWDDNVSRSNPEHLDVQLMPQGDAPAQKDFRVGDTANVVIASPFTGRLLLTVETDEVLQTQVVEMKGSHVVVPIKITPAFRPGAFVSATVVRPIDPNAKWAVHRAFGISRVKIDPSDRTLKIVMDTPAQIRPLQSLDVGLIVTDSQGSPVPNAAISVAAVDEGICDLTDYVTPNPLKFFTAPRGLGVSSYDLYNELMPEVPRPDKTADVGGDGPGPLSRHLTPIVARRVKTVALAWNLVHTDDRGQAKTSFPLPEFQGKLRVMAVACASQSFGSKAQDVIVRSPILAQTSWPRFAAPTDQFTVPIVLFNNTDIAGDAEITATADDAHIMTFGVKTKTVHLAAAGQAQCELPVTISQVTGVASMHLKVTMNGEVFTESMELPVRPAAPMTQYGGYLAATTTQPTTIAKSVPMLVGTETFHLNVAPWPTLQLSEGLDYLDRYPYGCVEQTTSTCFPLLTLGEIGKQIDPVKFDPDRIKRNIDVGILRLIGMQTSDGGLAMWMGQNDDWPYGSVYAAHFIVEAKLAGYSVPDDFYKHLLAYVRRQLDESTDDADKLELQSYAAYVLALAGKTDRAILDRLTELANAPAKPQDDANYCAMRSDSRLMLSCAWLLSGRRDLAESLIPNTMPTPRPSRELSGNIGSPIRDRALLINAMVMVHPDSPLLPALVQDLSDTGIHHQWYSTHDTALAVLAIGKYLREAPKHKAYESAQLLQGQQIVATSAGESLAWNGPGAKEPLTINITGAPNAQAFVSWLQTGVPVEAPAEASHGMKIHRKYLAMDGKEITHNIVRTGDLVRVQITIEAAAGQGNLAIEDMLPAGLEAENAHLKTTARRDEESDKNTFRIQNQDTRDDRVILFGAMPGSPTATCEYLARAVTPGTYVLPPVRIEAMYDIGTNALSGAGAKFTVAPTHADIASTGD